MRGKYTHFINSFGKICISNPNEVTIAIISNDNNGSQIAHLLNEETAPLHERIAKLEEVNADLLAVNEAQSEAIGAMRNYIRKVAGNYIYGLEEIQLEDYRQIIEEAQAMVAAWDKPETEVVE
jgi:hypothetical protein